MDVLELIQDKNPRKWNVSEFCSGFLHGPFDEKKGEDIRECVSISTRIFRKGNCL